MTLSTPATDWGASSALQSRIVQTLKNRSMLSISEASHGFELTVHGPGVPDEGAVEVRYRNQYLHIPETKDYITLIHMINYINALLDEGLTTARVRMYANGDMYVLVRL